jgi:predicted flavoprotein YhiN
MAQPDVVVIGAGAAGIFASWRAATLGARVLLLEKTTRIGTKILISGGGKCNITHAGTVDEVLRGFRRHEAWFLKPSFYRFTNREVVELLTRKDLEVYTRPDGRIFPVRGTAKDVVETLRSYLQEARVDVQLESPVIEILAEGGAVQGVRIGSAAEPKKGYSRPSAQYGAKALLQAVQLESGGSAGPKERSDRVVRCAQVILAVGGNSYPNSGTTGDGWVWARDLGHTVVKPQAALAPIYLHEVDAERSGVSLRDCVLRARSGGKEVARWRGDLLFTHQGISGPCALGISRTVAEHLPESVDLAADVLPDSSHERLQEELLQASRANPKRSVVSWVGERMAAQLAEDLAAGVGIDRDLMLGRLDRKARNRLVEALKGWPIGGARHVPLEKGEVAAGGVALDEVDPHTMRSLRVQGLFLCGEVLDIAGAVGGYNLQAAFSTGFVAGEEAARQTDASRRTG